MNLERAFWLACFILAMAPALAVCSLWLIPIN